jgi:hypothetical protein
MQVLSQSRICLALCEVYLSHIKHVIENSSVFTICKSSLSPGFAKQIMHILHILCYNGSLVTWKVVSLTVARFKPLIYILFFWLRLFLYCEHVYSHDFVWLLLVARSRIYTEVWKHCANHGPVCTLDNFQWCEERCFIGAAILIHVGRCLPLIPRRDKR